VRFGRKSNDDSCQTFPSFLLSSSAVVMVEWQRHVFCLYLLEREIIFFTYFTN
jgi:hypothetical protein